MSLANIMPNANVNTDASEIEALAQANTDQAATSAAASSAPASNSQVASTGARLEAARRVNTKVSTKNPFDGDATKFPAWRIKQLAIFRSSGAAAEDSSERGT